MVKTHQWTHIPVVLFPNWHHPNCFISLSNRTSSQLFVTWKYLPNFLWGVSSKLPLIRTSVWLELFAKYIHIYIYIYTCFYVSCFTRNWKYASQTRQVICSNQSTNRLLSRNTLHNSIWFLHCNSKPIYVDISFHAYKLHGFPLYRRLVNNHTKGR